MSQESKNPAERSKTAKFGFIMLRGALYVGNALTVGLLCFAAQMLFYMLCFLAAIALFILAAIVLPAVFVIIGFLIESPELALFGIIVALIAWGVMLACAACANNGHNTPSEIDQCIDSIGSVGQYIMIPWKYVNQKIGTIGKSNNQKQDHIDDNTERDGANINLASGSMNNNGLADQIENANKKKSENDLIKTPNNTEETINGQK